MMRRLKRASDHLPALAASLAVRRVYTDLDGTLLGPGGSLFASAPAVPGGPAGVTGEPAAAVHALLAANIDLVLVSGRTRDQVREAARTVGAAGYIAELGGLVVRLEGRNEVVIRNHGAHRGPGTPHDAIERSGAAGFLLEAYRGRLEPHAPWAFLARECSMLFRGLIDLEAARRLLEETGYGWLDLQDNGMMWSPPGRFPHLDVEEVHAYHLVPRGVGKRSAVAIDRAEAGLDAASCIAVGDSASDAEMAAEVGAMFVVANGEMALRGVDLGPNVYLLDRAHGLGFADAVLAFARAAGSGG
jgi:phosphoglycolate phosphatase